MFGEKKWLLIVVALLLVAAVPASYFWARSMASRRVVEKLEIGLGMDVQMESFAIDFSGFEIEQIELLGRGGGLRVKAENIHIDAGVFGVALRGTRAVKAVTVTGLHIEVELHQPGLRDSLSNLRDALGRRSSTKSSSTAKASKRHIRLQDMRAVVSDSHGILGQVEGAWLDKDGGVVEGRADRFSVGNRGKDRLDVTKLVAGLRHEDGQWRIAKASVDTGDLRWSSATSMGQNTEPPLVERLKAARAVLTQAFDAGPTSDAPAAEAPAGSTRFSRLTADAKLSANLLRLESATDRDRIDRLELNEVRVLGEPGGWFRAAGNGEASARGTVSWDMRFHPAELRSEGSLSFRHVSLAPVAPLFPEVPWYRPEQTTLSGDLTLRADSPAQVGMKGSVTLSNAAFSSPRLAPVPVTGIGVSVSGSGVWFPTTRRLELAAANIEVDGVLAQAQGVLEKTSEHYRVEVIASLPETNCNRVVRAIPTDVLGRAAAFSWKGTWGGGLKLVLDSRDLPATVLDIDVNNRCKFIETPVEARIARFEGPFEHRVTEEGKTVFKMETGPGTPHWVSLRDISPFVVQTIVSHEDASFFKHDGFAVWAIREALARNLEEGRYVVGASTISMQLAKNLFLHRDKTLARKIQEMLYTWWLEDSFTKDKLLELYLNVIEYGPNLYGIGPAAMHYFGRPASELSPAEAGFLASILPSPATYYRLYQLGTLSNSMKNRIKRLLEHMVRRGRLSEEALAYATEELGAFKFHLPEQPPPEPRKLPRPLPRKSMKAGPDDWEPPFLDPWEADAL